MMREPSHFTNDAPPGDRTMTFGLLHGAFAVVIFAGVVAAFTAMNRPQPEKATFVSCGSCDARNGNMAALQAKRAELIALQAKDVAKTALDQ